MAAAAAGRRVGARAQWRAQAVCRRPPDHDLLLPGADLLASSYRHSSAESFRGRRYKLGAPKVSAKDSPSLEEDNLFVDAFQIR